MHFLRTAELFSANRARLWVEFEGTDVHIGNILCGLRIHIF